MSSRAQHYRQAERLLEQAQQIEEATTDALANGATVEREGTPILLAAAQIHADLANVGDAAYSEYLDLLSAEQLREEVVGTPAEDSRQWLIEDDETP